MKYDAERQASPQSVLTIVLETSLRCSHVSTPENSAIGSVRFSTIKALGETYAWFVKRSPESVPMIGISEGNCGGTPDCVR